MTQIDEHPRQRATYRPRTHVQLAEQQLAAIERFHLARRTADAAASAASLTQDERLDRDRQRDVMRQQHAAIIAQCDASLSRDLPERRAVGAQQVGPGPRSG